jgi:hypothetical protein
MMQFASPEFRQLVEIIAEDIVAQKRDRARVAIDIVEQMSPARAKYCRGWSSLGTPAGRTLGR